MQCKECGIGITSENASKRERGKWRKKCRKCENGRILRWSRLNREKRVEAQRKYARSIGIGLLHPCETCGEMCKKKFKKAFCNEECRFMSHIEKTDACWLWKSKMSNAGYGVFNQKESAHRKAYELWKGEIPIDRVICHSCDNKLCVNPDHLWCGTQKENIQDAILKNKLCWQNEKNIQRKNKIKTLHREGKSQKEIASIVGVSQPRISFIINEKEI